MKTIFIAMPVFAIRCPDALKLLEDHGVTYICQTEPGPVRLDEFTEVLPNIMGIITGTESRWSGEDMDRMKNLKVISRFGIGYDNVDIEAAAARGIICTNVPDGNRNAVAEYTLALILSLTRRIPESWDTLRQGGWEKIQGRELAGKTVGLLGYGAIAKRVAELIAPFGVNLLACDPNPGQVGEPVTMVSMDTLLKESDIISIHVSGSERNQLLISGRELELMKRTAFLINMSRGGVVDEQALVEALSRQRLAGAASDVFSSEPPEAGLGLLKFKNFIGTCHIAGGSVEASQKIGLTIAHAMLDVLEGRQPQNIVH